MPLARTYSRAMRGIQAPLITIEADISPGLPGFSIVGLPTTAIKESKDRIRSAILNCGYSFPSKRITVNLAPADVPKEGSSLDLSIALGILAASEQIATEKLTDHEFFGELALSGELRASPGILAAALATSKAERILVTAAANASEAALPQNSRVIAVDHLRSACSYLDGQPGYRFSEAKLQEPDDCLFADMQDIRGQGAGKRGLEIAAAGKHSLLMTGPPGAGKTMLAERLMSILPLLSEEQALETAAVNSVSGKAINTQNWRQPPFRAPHHTASAVALVGGGNPPKPGEVSLAHHGVLFLDELPEFNRHVLETLREPLESGKISISRAAHQAEFPAKFQLIAAMNPCPCGHNGNPHTHCRCSAEQVQRYLGRLSGPLLDRIDIHMQVSTLGKQLLNQDINPPPQGEDSKTIKQRVVAARQLQLKRQGMVNHALPAPKLNQYCVLGSEAKSFLNQAMDKWQLSARAYHRVLRVARTIADLEKVEQITRVHLSEALSYRPINTAASARF